MNIGQRRTDKSSVDRDIHPRFDMPIHPNPVLRGDLRVHHALRKRAKGPGVRDFRHCIGGSCPQQTHNDGPPAPQRTRTPPPAIPYWPPTGHR